MQCQADKLKRLQKRIERFDLLVLDELGYVPFSKASAELLFEAVSRAYERRSLIVRAIYRSNRGRRSSATSG